MNKLAALIVLLATSGFAAADRNSGHAMHQAEFFVDGSAIDVDPEHLKRFTADLQGGQVAVVSVMGMVCDFCARGIEKPSSGIELSLRLMWICPRAKC